VSRTGRSRADQIDVEHQATDLAVGSGNRRYRDPPQDEQTLPPGGGVGMHQRLLLVRPGPTSPAGLSLVGCPRAPHALVRSCSVAVGPLEVVGTTPGTDMARTLPQAARRTAGISGQGTVLDHGVGYCQSPTASLRGGPSAVVSLLALASDALSEGGLILIR
jgi:hypothetical protein